MPPAKGSRRAPGHLSNARRALWRRIDAEFELDEHHRELLTLMCEALDRATEAREGLQAHGSLTVVDGQGTPKTHPLVLVERDSRAAAAKLLRELNLDGTEV